MEFGDKLKALREEKGWTQEELGEMLFVSRVTISKWETGRGLPNLDSLLRLSEITGISINDLISSEKAIECGKREMKERKEKVTCRFLSVLDILAFLLLILPIFRSIQNGTVSSVSLFALASIALWQKSIIVILISLEILLGLYSIIREELCWKASFASSLLLAITLVLALQPYPTLFILILIAAKVFIRMLR